ncbi:MAG: hypothetical protein ABI036_10385 [Fibrobacteria bacterium]
MTRTQIPSPAHIVNGIGVISGGSNAPVPAGWTKYPIDLNYSVGGAYVYLIYHI